MLGIISKLIAPAIVVGVLFFILYSIKRTKRDLKIIEEFYRTTQLVWELHEQDAEYRIRRKLNIWPKSCQKRTALVLKNKTGKGLLIYWTVTYPDKSKVYCCSFMISVGDKWQVEQEHVVGTYRRVA